MEPSTDSSGIVTRSRAEEIRVEIKEEWARLWSERYEDKEKAEGVSTEKYRKLSVERGQVIYATRDYRPLDFHEILEENIGRDNLEKISPPPEVGGWRKFAKENFPPKKRSKREEPKIKVDLTQHQRKGGRGWLNKIRIVRKVRESERENRY